MIRRLVMLPAVVVALVVGDVAARQFVETKASERAQMEAPAGASVDASVGGFPFLPPLLLGGSVNRVGVRLENVSASELLTFASVDLELRGVELDRGMLFENRKVRILDIDKGTIEVVITQEALSDALRVPVTIADGAVSVEILNRTFSVTPAVTAAGQLSLSGAAGGPRPLDLPKLPYVPCFGAIAVFAGRLQLSCEITEVPPALVDAVQQAS